MLIFHLRLFPTSPGQKKKKKLSFTLFYSPFLYCDRNLKNIGDDGLFFSLSARRTLQDSTVFQLEFRISDFEIEGDHRRS